MLSPRMQKWGLFGLLALSLGFNLSMNPEHFNNIARNEKSESMYSMDLAQEAAKPATELGATAAAKPAAPTQTVTATPAMAISAKNVVFTASTFTLEGDSYVRFKPEGENRPSAACLEYVNRPMKLEPSNKKDISSLASILNTSVCGDSSATAAGPEEKKSQKSGEKTEISEEALAKMTKVCDNKSDKITVLECHKKNLISLSKDLLDSKETRSIINSYFTENLKGELERGFKKKTIDLATDAKQPDDLQNSNEIADDLVGNLRGKNGADVIKTLISMKEMSYRAQLSNARNMVIQGQRTHDPKLIGEGMYLMNADVLRAYYARDGFAEAFESNKNIKGGDLGAFLDSNYKTPVDKLIERLRVLNTTIAPAKTSPDSLYAQFQIDANGLVGVTSNTTNSIAAEIARSIGQNRTATTAHRGGIGFGPVTNYVGTPTYNGATTPNSNLNSPTAPPSALTTGTPPANGGGGGSSGRSLRRSGL